MTRLTRLADAWVNHPWYDYLAVAVAVGAALTANPRDMLLSEQHGDWYQTLATVTGVLVSLAGVAITLVLTVAPNERLERVLQRVGPNLGRLVMSCIGGLVIATAGFAMLFLLETAPHRWRVGMTAALLVFTVLRFGRLWRLFVAVIHILTMPMPAQTPPAKEAGWQQPIVGAEDYGLPRRRVRRAAVRR